MKIVQLEDNRVHWITPYTWGDLTVDVEQENGVIEKRPRFSPDIIFVEAPNEVQEGFIYIGDGKFRSNELEILQAELETIEAKLRHEFDDYKFFSWIDMQLNRFNERDTLQSGVDSDIDNYIFSKDYKTMSEYTTAIQQLIESRQNVLQKLEALKNSEIKTFSF